MEINPVLNTTVYVSQTVAHRTLTQRLQPNRPQRLSLIQPIFPTGLLCNAQDKFFNFFLPNIKRREFGTYSEAKSSKLGYETLDCATVLMVMYPLLHY